MNELPEALKGKTPEEMYALLQAEHVRELEEVKKQTTIPVAPVTPPEPVPVQPQPYIPPAYVPPVQPVQEPDLFTNPTEFMEHQFQQRVAPLAQTISTTMRSTNREIFKNKIGAEEWDAFGQDIDKFVDSLHPSVQMQLDAYEAAANYVRGKRMPEIVEKVAAKRAEEAVKRVMDDYGIAPQQVQQPVKPPSLFQPVTGVVTPASPPQHFNPSTAPKKSKLTDVQKRMAQNFGMTEEEYLKYAEDNTDWVSQAQRGGAE